MSLKREWNRMEYERLPPPPQFSIFRVFCASAQELVDRESYASVSERTRLLAKLEEGYPFHLVDTQRQ